MAPRRPTLVSEDSRRWLVRDNNTGNLHALMKDSLALVDLQTGAKTCDAVGDIRSPADADRLISLPRDRDHIYLDGLSRLIREVGDDALVMPCCSPGYILGCYALGFQRAMEMMLTDPGLFVYVCDRYAMSDRLRMHQLAEAGAEAVYIADSWASCDIISPALFARFALPYQKSIALAARDAGLRAILWNLGDIVPILDLEAALPLDGFAFEQPRKGWSITVADVRRAFGPRRCLFGNVDSEALLLSNDPAEIARAVAEQLDQSGPGAPFILSTGSPLPSDVDPSAVDAIMAALRQLPPHQNVRTIRNIQHDSSLQSRAAIFPVHHAHAACAIHSADEVPPGPLRTVEQVTPTLTIGRPKSSHHLFHLLRFPQRLRPSALESLMPHPRPHLSHPGYLQEIVDVPMCPLLPLQMSRHSTRQTAKGATHIEIISLIEVVGPQMTYRDARGVIQFDNQDISPRRCMLFHVQTLPSPCLPVHSVCPFLPRDVHAHACSEKHLIVHLAN